MSNVIRSLHLQVDFRIIIQLLLSEVRRTNRNESALMMDSFEQVRLSARPFMDIACISTTYKVTHDRVAMWTDWRPAGGFRQEWQRERGLQVGSRHGKPAWARSKPHPQHIVLDQTVYLQLHA
jgi:hypothetical protein